MLVLFDQGTPVPICPFLKEHTVQTTTERGWDTLENGESLTAAEAAGFDVLVTSDKNIRNQQNLTVRTIALVVRGNPRWPVPPCRSYTLGCTSELFTNDATECLF